MIEETTYIEMMDKLLVAVEGLQNSFLNEVLAALLAMLGSVAAVFIVDAIKERYFKPREEFKKLRRKVDSTLSMYACYYTNQIDIARSDPKSIELYSSASKSMRELAVELMAFADEYSGKKCCGVLVKDISEAASWLIGLSNSFFTPYDCPEQADNRDNDRIRKKIRELLQIDQKW